MYERHIYFKNQLLHAGVESVLAEEEACRMEHTISEESFKKLKGSNACSSCIDCKGDDCKVKSVNGSRFFSPFLEV